MRRRRIRLSIELVRCRELIPGWRSQVSKVSMIKPTHSATASVARNPTMALMMIGPVHLIEGPGDSRVKASPATGRENVKIHLRTRCADRVTRGRKVMLSVFGG